MGLIALRNYDPQTGRWIQQDPFQEFASPYTGMGIDPVNFVDPTGGFLGLSAVESIVVGETAGAVIGGILDGIFSNE